MKWFMHPLLALIADATESELAKCIEYLKVENQILRDRLPKKIDTTEAKREKMLKVGRHLGGKIEQLVSIVSPRAFQRWVQADVEARAAKKENQEAQQTETVRHGNSKPEEVHNLVLQIRKETGWGAGRIKGELYRHGYRNIARSTINRILRENGFKPEPPDDPDNTWAKFLRRHASMLWACDCFTKPVLTMGG